MPPAHDSQPRLERKDFVVSSTQLEKIEACPATGVYVARGIEKKANFQQWYGIFVHRFLQYAITKGREEALAYVYTKKMKGVHSVCEKIDVDSLPMGQVEIEFAHNPIEGTSRRLPKNQGIRSADPDMEQYGRADLIEEPSPIPHVIDWKTGQLGDRHPARETQLLGLAASIRGQLSDPWGLTPPGLTRSENGYKVSLVGIHATGDLEWATTTLDDVAIDAYEERARRVQLRVIQDRKDADTGRTPAFVKGAHCMYCDLKPICPAQR